MKVCRTGEGAYATAESRWAGVGPYYAMFPIDFADRVVSRYTQPGDTVLDPFAGRATAIFSAAAQGRCGIGVELNPVGWVYARAKLQAAPEDEVLARFEEVASGAWRHHSEAARLPQFFHHCFAPNVRRFLLAARTMLDWKHRAADWTAMALLLVYLHGKRDAALSNQMRQTKSMAPDYSIAWWKSRKMRPPRLDPVEFFQTRLAWRYAKGRPAFSKSMVYLGDARTCLQKIARKGEVRARLLLTSPPYCGVTNYHYDQWLRLWMLGDSTLPQAPLESSRGRLWNRERYERLLTDVFKRSAKVLADDATVYIRTDLRRSTYDATRRAVAAAFPEKHLAVVSQPFRRPTQTRLFGDKGAKSGEIDLILKPG